MTDSIPSDNRSGGTPMPPSAYGSEYPSTSESLSATSKAPRAGEQSRSSTFPEIPHYEILRQISSGGMGVVYQALDQRNEQVVAIKVIHPQLVNFEKARKRFTHEAEAIKKLSHLIFVRIHKFGEWNGSPIWKRSIFRQHQPGV